MPEAAFALTVAVAVAVATTAIWIIWRFLDKFWVKPRKLEAQLKRQGISGTSYTFLVGDVRKAVSMVKQAMSKPISLTDDFTPRVAPLLQEIVKEHGKTSYMWFGSTPRVILTNAEHIKEVFSRVYDFPKPLTHPIIRMVLTGVVTYDGEKWSKHRRIINPAFHLEKLKAMVPALYESCSEMVSKWEKLVSEECSSGEVDVWPYLQSMTGDAISRAAFSSSYEEGKRIFELQDEQAKLVIKTIPKAIIFSGWRFLPTKNNMRMRAIDREVKERLGDIIKTRKKEMEDGEALKDDLLSILLESSSEKGGISVQDVIEECRLFYFAGQETTSVLLVWTLVLLSRHQEWQARARHEVFRVLGQNNNNNNNKPDFDALSELKTVNMILNEVLRLYPSGIILSRSTDKETKLRDLNLPPDVQIAIPVILIHRDPDLWGEDALEFKPERFEEGISKATKNRASFLPFGLGPRICPGKNFALTEAKMALSLILQRFSFELSPSYTHAPRLVVTLHPQFGAPLIFHKL